MEESQVREPFEGEDPRKEYLRVTTVIAPFSGVEFVPERYLVPAAAKGTLVHNYIESQLAGFEEPCDNDAIQPYLNSFNKFWDTTLPELEGGKITLEKRFYCDTYKITGKADLLVEFPDRVLIFDWKTSGRPHLSWNLQAAAYRYLAESNGVKNVKDVEFVKLSKYGAKPTTYKYIDYEKDLARFFSCLELYRFFKMDTTRNKWHEN